MLTQAYDAVRNGTSKWVLYTLTASNDLKIEEVGDSTATLRDLADEFSDGKYVSSYMPLSSECTASPRPITRAREQ